MNLIDWAQKYIDDGLRPIPLYHPNQECQCTLKEKGEDCFMQCWGKVPIYRDWADRDYFKSDDFSNDMNIGLAMGRQPSGKWLLGIDNDDKINHNFYDNLPKTLEAITGRGYHHIFEVNPFSAFGNWVDVFNLRPKNNDFKITYKGGIDLRYARGILTCEPSVHRSGTVYQWVNYREPAFLDYVKQFHIINTHAKNYPNVKKYRMWHQNPAHFHKNP